MIPALLRLLIALLIIAFLGYETLYAALRYEAWVQWMRTLPYAGKWPHILSIIVLITNGTIVLLLFRYKPKTGFILALFAAIICIAYLFFALLFTDYFFTPFHSYWNGMTWFHRMLGMLCIGWLSWVALLLTPTIQHQNIGSVNPATDPSMQEYGES